LAFRLPQKLQQRFFRSGLALLGIRNSMAAVLMILCSISAFWLIPEPAAIRVGAQGVFTARFANIPADSFMMGSGKGDAYADEDEFPQHKVTISKDFYIQTTEVTQAQWLTVMGNNPSRFKNCDDCPVEQVPWNDTKEFIKRLNELDDRNEYRLPTEAEWEYACRAGTQTPFAFGDCLDTDQANYHGNYPLAKCPEGAYREKTISVGTLKANAWGLFDMHGNVWEWVEDDWNNNYAGAPNNGSAWIGNTRGAYRVVRGGGWDYFARYCRSAFRYRFTPAYRYFNVGFRLVLLPVQ